jgi:hypothetical protein
LVARDAVVRWAFAAGIDVPDGPLDDMVVELYLNRDDCGRPTPGAGFELIRSEPQPEPSPPPVVVEPAPAAPSVALTPAPVAPSNFGPEPCASCGGPGYLDHIDLVRHIQFQRCRRCATAWQTPIVI